MAEPRRWYLITYDIRDPKRWRKVHELLKGYGEWLQLSVFLCSLTDWDREQLCWELSRRMDAVDTLLVIGLWWGRGARARHQRKGGLARGTATVLSPVKGRTFKHRRVAAPEVGPGGRKPWDVNGLALFDS